MTHGLRPYPEYKDAGVPWLGAIPAHWAAMRCKYLFREVDTRSENGEETHLSMSQKHGLIPSKDMDGRRLHSESYAGGKLCQPHDLVLNRLKAHLGVFAHARQSGVVSPDYTVLRPAFPEHVAYFEHVFKTPACVSELRCSTKGIVEGFWRLYTDDFYRIRVPLPPASERDAILAFLRSVDATVRRFIRNRRRLIEGLNEQKQAIINRSVTRGLDESAPLKPSGIDWLGDIPAHWHTKRLKYLVNNINSQTTTKQPDEVYIALEHVESWTGRVRPPANDVQFDSQVKRFQTGDVLFGKLRPYLAKVTRAESAGVCVGEFLVLRTADDSVLPEFLEAKLRSKRVIELINSSTFGAKMPRADWRFIGNLVIAYPPTHAEQRNILTETEAATSLLQVAIDRAASEIELVQEYRTRLIADVVTGKLDVRGFVPSEPVLADGSADEPIEEVGLEDEEAEQVEEAVDVAD